SGDIGKLLLMRDLSRYIQPPEDSKYLPHLVILLRDFGLEKPDSLKKYFLDNLARTSREAAEGIKKSFKEFNVFALPHPGVGGKRLQQMQAVSTTDLDDEF
ncbi:9132_t:CDS:2, partial [Paraglomus brasilianum]